MLRWAVIFLIISIVAGAFGLANVSQVARRISFVLFGLFFAGFLVLLVIALVVAGAMSAPFVAPPTLLASLR